MAKIRSLASLLTETLGTLSPACQPRLCLSELRFSLGERVCQGLWVGNRSVLGLLPTLPYLNKVAGRLVPDAPKPLSRRLANSLRTGLLCPVALANLWPECGPFVAVEGTNGMWTATLCLEGRSSQDLPTLSCPPRWYSLITYPAWLQPETSVN